MEDVERGMWRELGCPCRGGTLRLLVDAVRVPWSDGAGGLCQRPSRPDASAGQKARPRLTAGEPGERPGARAGRAKKVLGTEPREFWYKGACP